MKFSELAKELNRLEKTTSRNEMTKILAELLKRAAPEEVDKISYLLLGELVPPYKGIEFNIAEKTMLQVLSRVFQKEKGEINALYKSMGDLGDVVYKLALSRRPHPRGPSVKEVYGRMLDIAQEAGSGSQEKKIKKLGELILELDALSAKFVARIPVGKLRLGFSDATLLDALSLLERGDKSARPLIEQGYNITADIGALAARIKNSGLGALKKIKPQPGIPIRSSLAERLRSPEEAVEKAGPEVGVEQKLDGFRTQIHVWGEKRERKIGLFSRNLENTTAMFPEIVAAAKKLKVQNVILDGETIGYNRKTGKFMPFQETVQRKRKYDIEEFVKKIPLATFVFDILELNGKSLLELSFRKRREILERVLTPDSGQNAIRLATQKITQDPRVIEKELKESIALGLEGLVVKNLASPYEAGSRGFHWVKLKATTAALEELRGGAKKAKTQLLDTVDCLVMGAYRGRGKRAVFGVGGLLLGIRGQDGRYYSISRLGTGLSDEQFREAYKRIGKLKVNTAPKEYVVDKEIVPDLWVRPSLVVEILADEITLSPRHSAGRKEKGGRGYSLRFPRLVRFREDKNPEEATSVNEIKRLFELQKKK